MKRHPFVTITAITTLYLIFLAIMPLSAREKQQGDLYVATEGSDNDPGTLENPFQTPERARDAVREMRQTGMIPAGGLTIWIRGGDYIRTKTLDLNAEDSGTPEAPIIWRAYANERVRMLGGQVIKDFQPLKDEVVRERLDETARDKVLVTDLSTQGILDYGLLQSRGFGRPTVPAHGEVFFDGMPMTLARWPNAGSWELIADFPHKNGMDDGHGTTIGSLTAGFFYTDDRPGRWKDNGNIWLHGYWAYDWANSYERVAELDTAHRFIRTEAPYGHYGFGKGQRFYFLNILEEIDQPGEWFIDRQAGKLYFWPPAPVDSGEVLFSSWNSP